MGYGSENLIIKQKLEDAIEYSYCVFQHFPKAERFTLVADLKHSQIKILQLVIRANKSREKIPVLREIDTELEVFRTLVRLSFTLKFIAPKQYENISIKFNEFGRLLGGWMKQSRQQ